MTAENSASSEASDANDSSDSIDSTGASDASDSSPTWGIELTPEHPPDRIADLAAIAETEGFDVAFSSSHYFNRDPFVSLSRMAERTDSIALGPGVVNPFQDHPVTLAARMATIDEVSGGRAVYGIGAGDRSALSNLGFEHDRPLRRVLEAFTVARDLWAGETVTHDGTFTAQDASLNLEPTEIPVYVGAQGPHMLRMSAKHADGVLVNASHPRDLEWAANQVEIGLADRPDDRGPFEALAFSSVSVADEEVAAREAARPPVAFIAGGAAPPVIERHGLDEAAVETVGGHLEAGDLSAAFEAVTPAMIDAFAVAGTPETVADRFEAILEFVDGIVVGSPLGPDLEVAVEQAAWALEQAQA
ncbi:5,10-methylenetetrahydromethanopterin reductase [Natronosalvus caseinilyticus]|uniref:5,10-methylenetetrahydromethanopterin reductase n=1 Tax=Natronosalvus caseinilyticus TaxID=2953747 RepID=UPI0028AC2155|nr:5,10-methylenetetrahydromethanopterin reductase [Natronosalvus caseinilyticus]